MEDLSYGWEATPIEWDGLANKPTNFIYIKNNIPGQGVSEDDFHDSYSSCECSDGCLTVSCPCNFDAPHYSSDGKLLDSIVAAPNSHPVFECTELCSCFASCNNRLVQRGVTLPLQVFQTRGKGYGVKTLARIPKHAFVCEYAGEVIGKEEAIQRSRNQTVNDCNYIFVLREHSSTRGCTETIIDPTHKGNVGRYLNHSCDPNLQAIPIRANTFVPRVGMFAMRDIEPFEELCYDYSGASSKGLNQITDCIDKHLKQCNCGALKCKRYLPFDKTLLDS